MADKLIPVRNTRGYFEIHTEEGKIHKNFSQAVYTTERDAEVAIMRFMQSSQAKVEKKEG